MLKQELRKLRETDMQTVKMRQKRVDLKRKQDIVDKQLTDKKSIEEIRMKEHEIRGTRYDSLMGNNIRKEQVYKELNSWVQSGYSKHWSAKRRESLSPTLAEFQKNVS